YQILDPIQKSVNTLTTHSEINMNSVMITAKPTRRCREEPSQAIMALPASPPNRKVRSGVKIILKDQALTLIGGGQNNILPEPLNRPAIARLFTSGKKRIAV